jgi:predicted DsbA family dithiol-disulfide isomerase
VAAAEGLEYGAPTHWYNSVPAHQVALWADENAESEAFRRAVYRAYFVDGLNIAPTTFSCAWPNDVGLVNMEGPAHAVP